MITADGTLVLRIAELADSSLKYVSWRTCTDLIEHVDLSQLDTSQAKDLSNLLYGCTSLQSVDLSQLDISNVTSMRGMFADCKNLKSVSLLDIDTSNVTTISSMFSDCNHLKTISLAGIDTSHVVDFANAFKGCSSLATVDLAGIDTTSATNMDSMFAQCAKLQAIDISTFDMSKLGKNPNALSRMFDNCPSLERITVCDKCTVSFPEPGGSRATGSWINTASNEIYTPINVPANVAATYESQLDVTQFPFFCNPDDVTYTGSPIEKKVTSTLKQDRDYTVAYANKTKVGTAAIAIAGAGRYAGSMELPYDIVKATRATLKLRGSQRLAAKSCPISPRPKASHGKAMRPQPSIRRDGRHTPQHTPQLTRRTTAPSPASRQRSMQRSRSLPACSASRTPISATRAIP